ncbi:26S proteasome non-ATPase regulatory subunit 10 [Babesia microti strain RI]|uniref:26S proteasome non-ATPase regulatory subunit 10 n=1 Tax=Babesia microti (strain RI) TaxID=1133968 RepID=A0A1R4AAC4_BABMR|nr:26S proteasome non-ATPase regulatory subunit 10 [Babesia microti strain RI]SJK85940.1 26S proteasome non-ATPase regulatory subunit 10 [Babesia microti strain RI]|eukprot:XP_012648120.2 26S proteasome non-ATPase regulatory subunit 10 [Babesia microti strain RI]
MPVSIINSTTNQKSKRFTHVSRSTNKTTQSSGISVDDVLNKYTKYKAGKGVCLNENTNELDRLEFSISQLSFIKNTKLDSINRNIYDFVSSSIKQHESNTSQLTSNLSTIYTSSEYNDVNNLLLQASFWGNLEEIIHCLDSGAYVNYSDQVGRSAIHYSTALGSLDCVKFLISRGADVNAVDLKSWTSLHIAVTKNYTIVAKLLIDAGADVKALLTHKCAPSRRVGVYSTCIHFAAIKGNVEMTKLLMENGLSINDRDSANLTPLDYAAFRKNYRYLNYIIDNGGKIDNIDINNRTVLHSAALGGHVDNFKLLLAKGGNPKVRDNWGLTPYDLAVLRNHDKLIRFMEKNKCNIKGIDGIGGSMGPTVSDRSLANAIAISLEEPNVDSIAMAVKCLGSELCLKLLEAALAVDRKGGMMTMDGKRKRSRGGVFFFLLKELYHNGHVSRDDYAYIKILDRESVKPKTLSVSVRRNSLKHATTSRTGVSNAKISDFSCRNSNKIGSTNDITNRADSSNINTTKEDHVDNKLVNDKYSTVKHLNGKGKRVTKPILTKDKQLNNIKSYSDDVTTEIQDNVQLNHKIQMLILLQKFQQQLNVNNPIHSENNTKSSIGNGDSAGNIVTGNSTNKGCRKTHQA